jgi:hypothetical protein
MMAAGDDTRAARRGRAEQLAPGVYVDDRGTLHFDVPAILAHFDAVDTPAERERVTAMMRDLLRQLLPEASIRVD